MSTPSSPRSAESTPSWRQFRAIPFDATVAAVLKALDVDVPEDGRPTSFRAEGFLANVTTAGDWVVCVNDMARPVGGPGDVLQSAQPTQDPRDVLKAAKLTQGTPSGDALRMWLRWWGWVPKSEQAPAEPQEQTPMVV